MNANPVGNELQEVNWSWPEADRAGRRRLYEMYRAHALGFLYYLQHERGFRNVGLPEEPARRTDSIAIGGWYRGGARVS